MLKPFRMTISLIAAVSVNRVIGKDNKLLWNMPTDMLFFKNTTWGTAVIMGRKTFDALDRKPLKGRFNIVISSETHVSQDPLHLIFVRSWKEALEQAACFDVKEVFVIGGQQIYTLALPFADYLYLTEIDEVFQGDAYFPDFREADWFTVRQDRYSEDPKHAYDFTIRILKRKQLPLREYKEIPAPTYIMP